nr:hypothetical protein [Tanacetum cinerariifolium]
YLDDTYAYQEEHVMHDSVQLDHVVDLHADYTSVVNMIPYDQYVKDNEVPVVHRNSSSVQNDNFMMIYNDMCEPSAPSVSNSSQNAVVKNSLTAELATYREQVELYERRAKFELTEREQKINEQLRLVFSDRNFKEETLKQELHSTKLQLASTINRNKSMDLALNVDNVFQAKDCDAFDPDVDQAPTAQTMFMANLSSADPITDEARPSYDLDILSEVQDHDQYLDDTCAYQEEHVMHDSVQLDHVVDLHADYTSVSNMILYDQYVKDNEGQARTVKCYNCNALDAKQLHFLAGGPDNAFDDDVDEQPVQDLALNVDNVFQAEDCDAFDSDVDEALTAQTMFMANLTSADPITDEAGPSYDSDILSEVQDHDQYLDDICAYHEEHVMHDSVKLDHVVNVHADYTSVSNMIPYDQYVKENDVSVVHSNASSVPNDTFMMIYDDMCEPFAPSVSNSSRNAVVKNSLTAELATYREQVELPRPLYNDLNKVAIGYKNPLCLTRAKQAQPALYNGHEILKDNHAWAKVHNIEDTLPRSLGRR